MLPMESEHSQGKSLSVIICTYNPKEDVIAKCFKCIGLASAIYEPLEVIIVDNNSSEPLACRNVVKAFQEELKTVRLVVEKIQGLTPARLKGIKEAKGDLLIFIDDDNFISPDFFMNVVKVAQQYPFIGAFSGQVTLEYDNEPAAWTRKYWGMLIHRRLDKDMWSNLHFNNDTMPNGAGLCVTRDVAEHYLTLFNEGKRSFNLDRSKDSLMSGGDNDLAMCACDIGKGMGLFKALHLHHHIPAGRFTLEYLSRLAHGIYLSYGLLLFMRTGRVDKDTITQRIKHLIRISIMKKNDRIIQRACKKGLKDAVELIKSGIVTSK